MAAASGDAHPYPIYNARYRIIFPILDADGDLVTGATAPDSELSQDQGTFADATNEITEIATSSGIYYLDLIATELDTKSTAIIVKTTSSGAKTTPMVLYPVRLPVIRTGTAQAGASTTITLDSGASAVDDFYNGCFVNITNDSPANVRGMCRCITDYVGSTKVATVEAAWGTNPSSASTFEILLSPEANSCVAIAGTPMIDPSTAGRLNVNLTHWNNSAPNNLVSSRVDASVGAMAAGVVTAAAVATDAIDADALADGAITAATFAAGAIDATAIATGAIDADAIADNAIDAGAIAANAITSAKIAADAIGASQIANGAIDAATFAAGAIDSAALADSAVYKIIGGVTGTADSGSTTTIVDTERTEADTDYWKDAWVIPTSGSNAWQPRRISAFNAATDTITVDTPWTQAIGTNTYVILKTAGAYAGRVDGDVEGNVVGSVGSIASGGITSGSFAASAIDAAAIAPDAIGSSELAASAVTEIQSAILSDATPFAGANINATISSRATPAQVNAEVVDALATDTYAEPGQEAPAATNTLVVKIGYLFKAWRNRSTQTSTQYSLYNDDTTTLAQKSTVSDDATTFDRGEVGSGP